jgi:cytochrome c peroxidase
VGEFDALTDQERAGLWFYESRGGCWRCHSGENFSDEDFHNTGVGVVLGRAEEGRMAVTGRAEDRGRFKTPTLRGVALTAPYMHDGSLASLDDVLEFYRAGGRANPDLDPSLAPLEMTETDRRNLLAFLNALSR